MSESAFASAVTATPHIEYRRLDASEPLPQAMLGAVIFGASPRPQNDPRCVRVGLTPLRGSGIMELWHADGSVQAGFDGLIRYCADRHHLAGAIELDERRFGGLQGASEAAYAALRGFLAASAYRHPLRIWNYFDGINRGEGDAERYKRFCLGRTAGFGSQGNGDFPAATAIGRRDGNYMLQVYWLAGRRPGLPLENPRQVSAYCYPRQYGPAAPSFSRAMLVSERLVMISGTASIVGHASHHPGDVRAQLNEVLINLTSVLRLACALAPRLPSQLGASSLLKFYLRDAASLDLVETLLRERLPRQTPYMILEADICRSELLIEADCLHAGPSPV
jgi:chorismate lyase / 3-hydroxybenzoate synthase